MANRRNFSYTLSIADVLRETGSERKLQLANLKHGMFVSWLENEHWATAVVTDDGWFDAAVNCWRDSQMGDIDQDGYPDRIWYSDGIKISDDFQEETLRAASLREVVKYLSIVSTTDIIHGESIGVIVFDIEHEVFYAVENDKKTKHSPILSWCGRHNK